MTGRRRPLGCRLEYFGSPRTTPTRLCGPAFRLATPSALRRTDKILCRCFGAPVRRVFPGASVPCVSPHLVGSTAARTGRRAACQCGSLGSSVARASRLARTRSSRCTWREPTGSPRRRSSTRRPRRCAALHPCRASTRTPSQHAHAQRARRRAWWRAGDERDDGRHHGAPQARGARRHTTHTGRVRVKVRVRVSPTLTPTLIRWAA